MARIRRHEPLRADIAHAGSSKERLTVGVGVAMPAPVDEGLEDVLTRADAILSRAWAVGRDGAATATGGLGVAGRRQRYPAGGASSIGKEWGQAWKV